MSLHRHHIRIFDSPAEAAAALADGFDRLEHGPFQCEAWVRCWSAAFRPGTGLIAAAILDEGGRPVFLLPLVRESRAGLTWMTAPDLGFSDYNAPLVAADFRPGAAEFARLWGELIRALRGADLIAIEKTPAKVGRAVNPLTLLGSTRASKFVAHPVHLDGDFASLTETRFDGSFARSLARKRRKLTAKGRLAFTVRTGADALPALEQIQAWRARRFGDELCADALERGAAFYRSLVADGSVARVCALTLDDRLIGGCVGTVDPSGFRLLMVGHDDALKNWSPGMLAIESAIEWAVGEGLPLFDFTIGSERYKFDFGVTPEPLHELAEPLSLKGVLYVAYRKTRSLLQERRAGAGLQRGHEESDLAQA